MIRTALTRLANNKTYMWFWGDVLQPNPIDVPLPRLPRLRRTITKALAPLDWALDRYVHPEEYR